MSRETPQGQASKQWTLFLGQDAGDCGETPALVRLVELGAADALVTKTGTDRLELSDVASSHMDERGVVIDRTAEGVSVFNGGVASLNSLLREWDIAAGDCVQVRLGFSGLSDSRFAQFDHNDLRLVAALFSGG